MHQAAEANRPRPSRTIAVVTNTGFAMVHFYGGLLRRLVDNGWRVLAVAALDETQMARVREIGAEPVAVNVESSGTNPMADIAYWRRLKRLYRAEEPDVVHHFSTKPIIYGSLAAKACRVPNIINTVTGVGMAVAGRNRLITTIARRLYKMALRGPVTTIFINGSDRSLFLEERLVPAAQALLISSSRGVDTDALQPRPNGDRLTKPRIVMVSRMLWSKGVGEFIAAAAHVRARYPDADFTLIGGTSDSYASKNPDFVPRATLEARCRDAGVDWLGMQNYDAVIDAMRHSAAVVLPSYYPEGLPTVLIEAAALGVPSVTTDTPGCRDAVIDGETGILCAPRDPLALGDAICDLLQTPDQNRCMGHRARQFAVEKFDEKKIVAQLMMLYERSGGSAGAGNHASVRPIR